jgi:mycobactin peptide synthetase MbtE
MVIRMTRTLTGPRIDYPLGGRVDALVARWARDTPSATALTWRGTAISYLDLGRAAEGERQHLVARGVRPHDIVAVRLPRGPHLVAVLLGILAAGAAYAGGAMDWPRSRFDDIAARCGARLVIDEHSAVAPPADRPLRCTAGRPADPCCVFSTSGSTGRPRAVLTPHSGTTRIALDPLLGIDSTTHMLQISPLGWDINSMELWGPLINGGVSALYDGAHPGAQELRRAVAAGVNTVWLTTSLFNALVEEDVHCLDGLRCVLTGGEKISPGHVAVLRAAAPKLRIVNGYGPVESTVLATAYEIPETLDGADIPIGVPLANTRVLLRDDEIVLAGDGLGTGYLGEPAATAERFRADGYHTGDLGRVDDDGLLYFTGRSDRQLKIRGARIAPEEVEAVMDALPGVQRSVLLAAPTGTETLACYCGTAEPAAVRSRLAERFPAAFVPRVVHRLDAMPTTSNGKLDSGALLALVAPARPSEPDATATPEDPVAEVVRVAAGVLGFPVGRDTDLLDAGANSINVIRLAGRLRLGADTVLARRTPAAIAAALAAVPREHGGAPAAEADPTRWVAGLPITQYRMWWSQEYRPGAAEVIYPLLFRVAGPFDPAAFARAVRAVAARHEALHTSLRRRSRRQVDAVPAGEPPECTVGEYREEAVRAFCTAPFDLAAGPPIRAAVFRRDESDHLLAVAVHRVAFDGSSEAILSRDLSAGYAGAELSPAPGFRAVAWEQAITAPPPDRFWHEHLRGVPDLPPLGAAAGGIGPVTEHALALRPATTAEWLAAWVLAVRAETGAVDFALRMPLVGRTLPAADDVIGCFATSAALRFPAAVRSFEDCVAHATGLLERLLANQHVPIEQIAAEREPTGRNPICQVAFALQNTDPAVLTLPGATARRVRPPYPDSALELALEIHPAEDRAVLWHRTDVLPADRGAGLADRWQTMLRSRPGVPA